MSPSSSVRSVKDLAHFSLKARQGNSQQVPVGGLCCAQFGGGGNGGEARPRRDLRVINQIFKRLFLSLLLSAIISVSD